MTSWHSYPSIFAIGHRYITDLMLDDVLVEEKVDGSQFSFGKFLDENGDEFLRCRSKGQQLDVNAPEKMFSKAVDTAKELFPLLKAGYTYRAEYLNKPKHNTLAYDRNPNKYLIIFDISPSEESYLDYEEKRLESERIGLECVPCIYHGKIDTVEQFKEMLNRVSILGGQDIEGVVVKNYSRFGQDKKILIGKYVSDKFKEIHHGDWKKRHPAQSDIIINLVTKYKTEARWNKAVQHLKERGLLDESPKDIGLLMKETSIDILKECEDDIKQDLFDWGWSKISRGLTNGLPEWYKNQLLNKQFDEVR